MLSTLRIINQCEPRHPKDASSGTKCSLAAQIKQAKRACIIYIYVVIGIAFLYLNDHEVIKHSSLLISEHINKNIIRVHILIIAVVPSLGFVEVHGRYQGCFKFLL